MGLFAVGFGCAAVRGSGWFPWVGVAVFALLLGLMFFASYRLLRVKVKMALGVVVLGVGAPWGGE